jgi:hypothetical protein
MSTSNQFPSETFAVGEIAVLHGLVYATEWNGVECEIIDGLDTYVVRARPWDPSGTKFGFRVRAVDGKTGIVHPRNLRKKRPPRDDLKIVRWDECPWQPESINV